jgi:E3 ubiquitin-protein ligase FANCL
MDEIDHNTWVLDPESPSRSCVYRRIVISSSTSVHLTVNPMKCLDVPDCTLLGPTHAIDPLKNILYSQLHKWNNSVSLLTNLQMVLSLEFPLCSTTNKDDYVVECGICYAHRLHDNETTPDITCNNHHCVQVYHYFCLYEWFRSLPTTRENFNLLFGECPYCNEGITIPLKT